MDTTVSDRLVTDQDLIDALLKKVVVTVFQETGLAFNTNSTEFVLAKISAYMTIELVNMTAKSLVREHLAAEKDGLAQLLAELKEVREQIRLDLSDLREAEASVGEEMEARVTQLQQAVQQATQTTRTGAQSIDRAVAGIEMLARHHIGTMRKHGLVTVERGDEREGGREA